MKIVPALGDQRSAQEADALIGTWRLLELADLVTEMREIKHPFAAGIKAQKGIEF